MGVRCPPLEFINIQQRRVGILHLRRSWVGISIEKNLRRFSHLRRLNIFQHSDLRRHWEGFPSEKDLRSMELLQNSWDGFEKVRSISEGNVPSQAIDVNILVFFNEEKNLLRWLNNVFWNTCLVSISSAIEHRCESQNFFISVGCWLNERLFFFIIGLPSATYSRSFFNYLNQGPLNFFRGPWVGDHSSIKSAKRWVRGGGVAKCLWPRKKKYFTGAEKKLENTLFEYFFQPFLWVTRYVVCSFFNKTSPI